MMVVDPVCGMKIESEKAKYKTVHKGKVYYFCSLQCKRAFEENPEYYLIQGPKGMSCC